MMGSLKRFLSGLVLFSVFEWTQCVGFGEDCRSVICNESFVCDFDSICKGNLSLCVRKPTVCIGENKGADQLCSYCTADQGLCFRYKDLRADGMTTGCNSTNAICPSYAVCNDNDTCSCLPGARAEDGLCRPVMSLVCSDDRDCTGVPGGPNYKCVVPSPCSGGSCWCANNAFEWNCLPYPNNNMKALGYSDECDVTADQCDVNRGLSCDNVTLSCTCSDNSTSYRSEVGQCTSKAVFGESCLNDTDCFSHSGYTTRDGHCGNGTCGCIPGFIPNTKRYTDLIAVQTCLSPYLGDECTSACYRAGSYSVLPYDTSQRTPNCSASRCVCDPGDSIMPVVEPFYGCRDICVDMNECKNETYLPAATNATALPIGANCTSYNECGSEGICLQCPGDSNGVCYTSPCLPQVLFGEASEIAARKRTILLLLVIVLTCYTEV